MTRFVRGLAICTLLIGLNCAQSQTDSRLPVKRVVLYKNGVGYFEHVGRIEGNQDVALPFTSGQLNDVLKSLTVLDLGGGRITGVGYGSSAPADRQIGDLRLPVGERATLTDFLGALRGAKVEIRSSTATIAGRVLSVERKTRSANGGWNDVDVASLIAENGEVRTAELLPGFSVKLLDPALSGRIGRYLDIVSSGREPDIRRMTISTEGTGERDLFVSYVSEVPVWKSTYRIVLGEKEPLLQGWAIVDNTVGQDWENVQLSLIAGAPQSFVQNLSQPYFTRRPMVPLPESVSATPQTYQATLVGNGAQLRGRISDPGDAAIPGAHLKVMDAGGNAVAEAVADANGTYEFASLPEGPLRLSVDAPGFSTTVVNGLIASASGGLNQDVRMHLGTNRSR
jgi:Carboxypeptidase regulatory-like domain